MRFSASIQIKDDPPHRLPTNYRIKIASLIKEAIKRENIDLYNSYWGDKNKNVTKPFTFSLYIPEAKHVNKNGACYLEFPSQNINLTLSSSDFSLLINLYNALLNISGKYSIFTNYNEPEKSGRNMDIKNFRLLKEEAFHDGIYSFRFMSPLIIRDMTNRKGKSYLVAEDPDFHENLYHSIAHQYKIRSRDNKPLSINDITFTPVNCRTVKIHHYREVIPAVSGTFKLEGKGDIIQMLYDEGAGARKSQGFGMMELLS